MTGEEPKIKRFKIKRTKGISIYRDFRYFIFQDDGDEDIVVCNNIGAPFFYQNQQREPNNWIRVRVVHRYVKGALITDKTFRTWRRMAGHLIFI